MFACLSDASKDFWDSKKSRRILWGWAQAGHTGKTLPRELTYDPRLKQIVQTPVPELQQVSNIHKYMTCILTGLGCHADAPLLQLRSSSAVASVAATVKAGAEQPLYGKAAGNASDALVTFQLPKAAGLFGKSPRTLCHGRAFPRVSRSDFAGRPGGDGHGSGRRL